MNPSNYITPAVLAGLLLAAHSASGQHLNVGAVGQNQNDQLVWDTHELGDVSSFAKQLTLSTSGRYAGYYNGNLTLTALHNTDAGGPALGSFIMAEIVSVAGPAGASFGFWEGVDLNGGTTPTASFAIGTEGLAFRYALSDASLGAGLAGQDPYGHLHGRRFTATHEGLYIVGFRAVDSSANGLNGSAIHTSSEIIYIQFAAVPEPSAFAIGGAGLLGLWLMRRKRKS
jgi:PEP-CTERM motif